MTSHFKLPGYPVLLRHVLQLFLLITLSTLAQPYSIFDFNTSGSQVASNVPTSNSDNNNNIDFKSSWRSNPFGWRSKRSEPPLPPLNGEDLSQITFQKIFAPKTPSNFHVISPGFGVKEDQGFGVKGERRSTRVRRLLRKIKQISDIREALRRRDKFQRSETPRRLISGGPKLRLADLSPSHQIIKSRRAKIMDVSRRLSIAPRVSSSRSRTMAKHSADFFGAGHFGDSFSSPRAQVEMFPELQSNRAMGSFHTEPKFLGSGSMGGGGSSLGSSSFFSEPSGSFKSMGSFNSPPVNVQGGFGDAIPFPSNQGSSSPFGDFSETVGFVSGNKDCPTIGTKSCSSDSECSCHGFYSCVRGRCDIKQQMLQGESGSPATGMWHSDPVDFGFSKRDDEDDQGSPALAQTSLDSNP